MVGIRQLSQMLKSLHSDTNDGHALNSLHGILQTTSSKRNALLRLRIAKIFPFRYQRWPWTKQPSWNSSNNIFKPIFSLEQKIDGNLQGKIRDPYMLKSFHSDFKDGHPLNSHLRNSSTNIFQTIYALEQKLDGRLPATWRLRNRNHPICISKIV